MPPVGEIGRKTALVHLTAQANKGNMEFTRPFRSQGREGLGASGELVKNNARAADLEFAEPSQVTD